MSGNSAVDVYKEIAKESNKTQIKLQQMADKTTAKTFEYNTREAEKSRAWQKEMSDTSHQREVKDLQKAGLNPVLSANNGGAASYTTSSASAEADNPMNAVANLEASKYSASASLAGSQISADAMRESAKTSAAATLAAAEAAAEAAKYKADKDAEVRKYVVDKEYEIAMDRPASNPWQLADKWLQKTGVTEGVIKAVGNIVNRVVKNANDMFVGRKASANHFVLDKQGVIAAQDGLKKLGLPDSSIFRKDFIKGYVFDDKPSLSKMEWRVKTVNDAKSDGYGKIDPNHKFYIRDGNGKIVKSYYSEGVQTGKNTWKDIR